MPKRVTIVDLVLKDGTKLNDRVEAVRGTSDNPMSHDEVVAKATDLMGPVFGAAQTKNFIEKVFALEKVKNITELRPLLQHA
jgi:hypothetical protein